ncbi:MAG: hypothetical protein ACOCR1_00890 [Planctomycetota bacterium]
MGPLDDPVETIQELYEDPRREIPYPIFMRCFDQLLNDPPSPDPAPPTEDLKQYFRAVCMALDLGIADQQERDKDRREEFDEYILPVWEDFLPENSMQACREILDGTVRERMEKIRRQEEMEQGRKKREEEEETLSEATREQESRFALAMEKALQSTEDAEAEAGARQGPIPQPDETDSSGRGKNPEEVSPPGKGPEENGGAKESDHEEKSDWTKDEDGVPLARSARVLAQRIRDEQFMPDYDAPDDRRPRARYYMGKTKVDLELISDGDGFFVLLAVRYSLRHISQIHKLLAGVADKLGYDPIGDYACERENTECLWKIQAGKKGTYVLCRRDRKFESKQMADAILSMHEDMVYLLNIVQKAVQDGTD